MKRLFRFMCLFLLGVVLQTAEAQVDSRQRLGPGQQLIGREQPVDQPPGQSLFGGDLLTGHQDHLRP